MTDRLEGKVAIVTGGGSGLGEATSIKFAEHGAAVVVTDINGDAAANTAKTITEAGGRAISIQQDVVDEAQWISVLDRVVAEYGKLDVAVNCAGISIIRTQPDEATFEQWHKIISVNLDAIFLATKYEVATMKKNPVVNGSIINFSSIAGIVGIAGLGPYNASKGGVRSFTKGTALTLAESGINIRVNSIHPGFIDTPMVREAKKRINDPEVARKLYEDLQPVGRLGRPEEIAWGAVFLASDESSFVTGAELVIDGGFTAR